MPGPLTELPLSRALFGLTASVSERRHAHVYERATELRSLVTAPDFSESVAFSQTLATLTGAFLEAFRTRVVALVARAYTTVPVQLAQTYLGLPQEQVLSSMCTLYILGLPHLLTFIQSLRLITGDTIRRHKS